MPDTKVKSKPKSGKPQQKGGKKSHRKGGKPKNPRREKRYDDVDTLNKRIAKETPPNDIYYYK